MDNTPKIDFVRPAAPIQFRRLLLTTGMAGYTSNGIIGLPSKATAEKGHALLAAFSRVFKEHLAQLQ